MKVEFDESTGRVVTTVGSRQIYRDITDEGTVYAVLRWIEAHFDGYPYEITGPAGTYRVSVEKVEPERVPYA